MSREVRLQWEANEDINIRFNVYRCDPGSLKWLKLNDRPLLFDSFVDSTGAAGVKYRYQVRSINRHGIESTPGDTVFAEALPEM